MVGRVRVEKWIKWEDAVSYTGIRVDYKSFNIEERSFMAIVMLLSTSVTDLIHAPLTRSH